MKKGTIQALDRGLEILRHVSLHSEGLRLFELAERMQLGRTTIHNLAKTLIINGFLVQDTETRYHVGAAIKELYFNQRENSFMHDVCKNIKNYAANNPEQTIYYSELQNGDIFTRVFIRPDNHGLVQQPWNSLLPPFYTAAGLVYFAFSSEEELSVLKQKHSFNLEGINVWDSFDRFTEEVDKVKYKNSAIYPFDTDTCRLAIPLLINNILKGVFTFSITLKNNENSRIKELKGCAVKFVKELNYE